jgi:hypothetical protein
MSFNRKSYLIILCCFIYFLPDKCFAQHINFLSNEGHTSDIRHIQFSHDGRLLLSFSKNEWIIWEARTGNVLCRSNPDGSFEYVNFSSGDNEVIAVDKYKSQEKRIKRWNIYTTTLIQNISLDSIAQHKSYNEIKGIFFQENQQKILWWDDGLISLYDLKSKSYNSYKDLDGNFSSFNHLIVADDKVFVSFTRFRNDNVNFPTSYIYAGDLRQGLTFKPVASADEQVLDILYCKNNQSLYCATYRNLVLKIDLKSGDIQKIIISPYTNTATCHIYEAGKTDDIYISYGFSGGLLKLNEATNKVDEIMPAVTDMAEFNILSPADPSLCVNSGLGTLQYANGIWNSTYHFSTIHLEGDGQFNYFGDNLLFLHRNNNSFLYGFFIDLNNFKLFQCKDTTTWEASFYMQPLPKAKKEIIGNYKIEGQSPNFTFHHVLLEYDEDGKLSESYDLNKIIKQLSPNDWISFYVTPDEKQLVVTDTSQTFFAFIDRGSKKVDKIIYPGVKFQSKNFNYKHPLLFGPLPNQMIFASDKIALIDIKRGSTTKVIDEIGPYDTYRQIVFDHDSTHLIFQDNGAKCVKYAFRSGTSELLPDLKNSTAITPFTLMKQKMWAVGYSNGTIELRDSSLQHVLKAERIHNGSVNEIYFDPVKNKLYSIGNDSHICITSAKDLSSLLVIMLQRDQNAYSFFAFNPANEYYYPMFTTDIIHLAFNGATYDITSLDKFKNRPDRIVSTISTNTSLVEQLKEAYQVRKKRLHIPNNDIDVSQLPKFHLKDDVNVPPINSTGTQEFYLIIPKQKSTVTKLHILANGVPVYGVEGKMLPVQDTVAKEDIGLVKGVNYIQFFVEDKEGNYSLREDINIEYIPGEYKRQKFIFIGIGVGNYADKEMKLPYSDNDILAIDSALKAGCRHEDYTSYLFLDTQFDNECLQKITAILQAASKDVAVILYYSGHGTRANDKSFLFCPYNTNFSNPDLNGIRMSDMLNCFDQCQARKRLVIIDACEGGTYFPELASSGQTIKRSIADLTTQKKAEEEKKQRPQLVDFYNSYFSDLSDDYGVQILASSYFSDPAFQKPQYHHSIFSYCFLNGLDNLKTVLRTKFLSQFKINDLRQYLNSAVPLASSQRQIPATVSFNVKYDWEINDLLHY